MHRNNEYRRHSKTLRESLDNSRWTWRVTHWRRWRPVRLQTEVFSDIWKAAFISVTEVLEDAGRRRIARLQLEHATVLRTAIVRRVQYELAWAHWAAAQERRRSAGRSIANAPSSSSSPLLLLLLTLTFWPWPSVDNSQPRFWHDDRLWRSSPSNSHK